MSDVGKDGGKAEYRFAGFRLDTGQRKLFSPEGAAINLNSRAFDTLHVLLQNRGETLSKDYLIQTVWPSVVEENNLSQAIYALRRALGDSRGGPRFIITVPGRGYCFVAPVELHRLPEPDGMGSPSQPPGPGQDRQWPAGIPSLVRSWSSRPGRSLSFTVLLLVAVGGWLLLPPAGVEQEAALATGNLGPIAAQEDAEAKALINDSIAVLPFSILNTTTDNELFALGLHDEVINQLSRISKLNVVARNSVLALVDQGLSPADIARSLRVESVLGGTILFVDTRARISLQLLDPATGISLWGGSYEANQQDLEDMIAIQNDIAIHVASALQAEIEEDEYEQLTGIPAGSFEAYRYTVASKSAYYQQDFPRQWELARKALALDPDYYDALHSFAGANSVLATTPLPGMSSREHIRLALEAAERMIALAPQHSEGHVIKAYSLSTSRDWSGVVSVLDTLAEMDVPLPDMKFIPQVLMSLGRFDEAIEIYEANLVTQPLNLGGRGFFMLALELSGRQEQARREYLIGGELSPSWLGDVANVFLSLSRGEALEGVEELPGISEQLRFVLHNHDDADLVHSAVQSFLGSEFRSPLEARYYAALAAHIGENELAVQLMRISLDELWTHLHWYWLPVFDDARKLESFRQLLRESGVVDYWNRHGWEQVCQPLGDSFTCDWSAYK